MKINRLKIASKEIVVLDGILGKAECDDLYNTCFEMGFDRNFVSSFSTNHPQWGIEFDPISFRSHSLFSRVVGLISSCLSQDELDLRRVYCKMAFYGDMTYIHRDNHETGEKSPKGDAVSCIVYANPDWNAEWGGETLFFDDDMDAVYAISPKPGRVVLFDPGILHSAGVPKRICDEGRLTFILRFRGSTS